MTPITLTQKLGPAELMQVIRCICSSNIAIVEVRLQTNLVHHVASSQRVSALQFDFHKASKAVGC